MRMSDWSSDVCSSDLFASSKTVNGSQRPFSRGPHAARGASDDWVAWRLRWHWHALGDVGPCEWWDDDLRGLACCHDKSRLRPWDGIWFRFRSEERRVGQVCVSQV